MTPEEVAKLISQMPDKITAEDMQMLILSLVHTYQYTGEQCAGVLGECIALYVGHMEESLKTTLH